MGFVSKFNWTSGWFVCLHCLWPRTVWVSAKTQSFCAHDMRLLYCNIKFIQNFKHIAHKKIDSEREKNKCVLFKNGTATHLVCGLVCAVHGWWSYVEIHHHFHTVRGVRNKMKTQAYVKCSLDCTHQPQLQKVGNKQTNITHDIHAPQARCDYLMLDAFRMKQKRKIFRAVSIQWPTNCTNAFN